MSLNAPAGEVTVALRPGPPLNGERTRQAGGRPVDARSDPDSLGPSRTSS